MALPVDWMDDPAGYARLIDKYGGHYIHGIKYGASLTSTIASTRTTEQTRNQLDFTVWILLIGRYFSVCKSIYLFCYFFSSDHGQNQFAVLYSDLQRVGQARCDHHDQDLGDLRAKHQTSRWSLARKPVSPLRVRITSLLSSHHLLIFS